MKEINIDRVYPLNRHHNIKILHDFNPLKSFTLSNASLDLHLSRSLISQLCLDNSECGYPIFQGFSLTSMNTFNDHTLSMVLRGEKDEETRIESGEKPHLKESC